MINANKIQPDSLAVARESIGLSLSTVAKLTGINRNNLSKYEKENGSLTLGEKKKLIALYEERGYDFALPEKPDTEALQTRYHQSHEDTATAIKQAGTGNIGVEKLGDMMMAYLDASHDVLIANQYLDRLNQQEPSLQMTPAYRKLRDDLLNHFKADKQGKYKDKVSFFGDSADGRGEKLMALLSYMKLQELQAQAPDLVTLSQSHAEEKTDNFRLLKVMANAFDDDSLSEFEQFSGQTIS